MCGLIGLCFSSRVRSAPFNSPLLESLERETVLEVSLQAVQFLSGAVQQTPLFQEASSLSGPQ